MGWKQRTDEECVGDCVPTSENSTTFPHAYNKVNGFMDPFWSFLAPTNDWAISEERGGGREIELVNSIFGMVTKGTFGSLDSPCCCCR